MTYDKLHFLNDKFFSFSFSNCNKFSNLSKDEELILTKKFIEKNDLFAIKTLVESNLSYIIKISKRYEGYGLILKDLVQEGVIGFIKAIKKFDPSKNVRLISFAIYWIKSEIHDYIIKNLRIVRVATTKSQKKLFFNLKKIKHFGWFNENERKVISNLFNVNISDVIYVESRLNNSDMSLDEKITNFDYQLYDSQLYSEDDVSFIVENENWNKYLFKKLKEAIDQLDDRSKSILKDRWFLKKKKTLKDLSKKYNLSSERIRQLENNAIKKIKSLMNLEYF